MSPKATAKSEETRARIFTAALSVFGERGFDEATMREVAARAGVAVGAAYYYFDSKEALVMAFYEQMQDAIAPVLEQVLANSRTLEQRLRGIIGQRLTSFAPNRALLGTLSAHSNP